MFNSVCVLVSCSFGVQTCKHFAFLAYLIKLSMYRQSLVCENVHQTEFAPWNESHSLELVLNSTTCFTVKSEILIWSTSPPGLFKLETFEVQNLTWPHQHVSTSRNTRIRKKREREGEREREREREIGQSGRDSWIMLTIFVLRPQWHLMGC